MSRRWKTPDLPPIVGVVDAAEILGVSTVTLHRWINSGYMIEPQRLASGPVWAREDIERFAVEFGRQRAPKRASKRS